MKKEITLLVAIIVLGTIWISHLKAQIDYADTECPKGVTATIAKRNFI